MIPHMDFKGIESAASMNKSKKKKRTKYMENENIMIKTNIHAQHICLTDFTLSPCMLLNNKLMS